MGGSLLAETSPPVWVELLPLTNTLSQTETFEVAVIFTMVDDWHIYWQNPGESGMPTSFTWELPQGFSIISQQEPVPERHVEDGITTFIHEKEAIYLFQVQTPDQVSECDTFSLIAEWLECRELCRPGSATLSFTLPDSAKNPRSLQQVAERARAQFPVATKNLISSVTLKKKDLLKASLLPMDTPGEKLVSVEFFPFEEMIYDISSPPVIKTRFWRTSVNFPLLDYRDKNPEFLQGVLVGTYSTTEGQTRIATLINKPIQS